MDLTGERSFTGLVGRWGMALAVLSAALFVAGVLCGPLDEARAEAFTVNATTDEPDASPGDGLCDSDPATAGERCTLRAAVMEANATPDADEVSVPAGDYRLTIPRHPAESDIGTNSAVGDLDVTQDLDLIGAGARSTVISGAPGLGDRMVQIEGGPSVDVLVDGVTITGGKSGERGGGIRSWSSLVVRESTVRDNTTREIGGGIYSTGPLEIIASTVSGNEASFKQNGVVYDGAAGGVYQENVAIKVVNSTISHNVAADIGGGLIVFRPGGTLDMLNSTVASNVSPGTAGNPGLGGGILLIFDATASVKNSIVWGNTESDCESATYGGGAITSLGGNISGDASCNFNQPNDKPSTDPGLGPLADYGGPTDTRMPGNPEAIDAGGGAACPATDARGVARPQDGDGDGAAACDIGAFERRPGGGAIGFAPTAFSAGEAAGAGSASVTVTRTGGEEAAFVRYATGDADGPDAAVAGQDYRATSGTLAFREDQTTRSFTVPILDDPIDEADETLELTLSDPAFGFGLGEQSTSELTIADDDDSKLSVDDRTVTEGDSGAKDVTFTATLSAPHSRTVKVSYATADRSATAPSDYGARTGQLTFNPDQLSRTITVPVLGETRDETDETFKLDFSGIQNASIGDGRGTGTIEDDDTTDVPLAADDSYATSKDLLLRVAAPGVLGNDSDPDGEALSALKTSGVSHGILSLEPDGSFAYRPDDGFLGRDSFTYRASDGASRSDVATVEIQVKDPAPTIKSVAPVGSRVNPTANVTVTFSEAMDADTISTETVKLTKKGAKSPVPATVSYDPATMKATLDPAKQLVKGSTYTATVSTGVQDTAGNALAATKSWRFTVKG